VPHPLRFSKGAVFPQSSEDLNKTLALVKLVIPNPAAVWRVRNLLFLAGFTIQTIGNIFCDRYFNEENSERK
jgi:hypothetical protein